MPNGPGVMNMDLTGRPLLQALASVEAVCAERGITKVAVMGLGFEDEADDLAHGVSKKGRSKNSYSTVARATAGSWTLRRQRMRSTRVTRNGETGPLPYPNLGFA